MRVLMTLFGLFSESPKAGKPRKLTKDEATNIWLEGFRAGFDKAFDLLPEMSQEIRKKIESQAINDTLKRLNGNLLPKT